MDARRWLLGLLLRLLVFVGIEVAALAVNPTSAVGIGVAAFVIKVVVAAGWGYREGQFRLSAGYALIRWVVVVVLTGVVAPLSQHLGEPVTDYALLGTDLIGSVLVFGAPVLLVAAGGWAIGSSARRRVSRAGG